MKSIYYLLSLLLTLATIGCHTSQPYLVEGNDNSKIDQTYSLNSDTDVAHVLLQIRNDKKTKTSARN